MSALSSDLVDKLPLNVHVDKEYEPFKEDVIYSSMKTWSQSSNSGTKIASLQELLAIVDAVDVGYDFVKHLHKHYYLPYHLP